MQPLVKEKNKPKLLLHMSYFSPKAGWGWGRSLHCHDFCEIMFVKKGSGKVVISDREFDFSEGDVIVYNPGTMHREFVNDVNPRTIMFLGISNLSIDGLNPGDLCKDGYAILHTRDSYDDFCFYLDRLFTEKELKTAQSSAIGKNLLNIIISYVIRLSEDAEKAYESKKTYTEIMKYIDAHYTEIDSIDGLCRSLFLNRYYLTHLFKDVYGISPLQYVIKKRITLAKHLLVNSDQRVDEIATYCGYSDEAYFCRIFKKCEGITPLKFRKQHRTIMN